MIFRFFDPEIHILDTATSFVWLLVFEISMTDNLGAWPIPSRSRDNWKMNWICYLDSLTPKTLYWTPKLHLYDLWFRRKMNMYDLSAILNAILNISKLPGFARWHYHFSWNRWSSEEIDTPGIFVSFRSPRDKFFKHLLLHYKQISLICSKKMNN